MPDNERLHAAAAAIYRAIFTAAPIDFEEARRRDAFAYRRALAAAEEASAALAA